MGPRARTMRLAETTALLITMVGFSGIAHAQQQCKIVLVNLEVVTRSNESKADRVKFDAYVAELKKPLDHFQAELSRAEKQKEKGGAGEVHAEAERLNVTIRILKNDLAKYTQKMQTEVDRYREYLIAQVTKSAFETAKQVAAE